MKVNSYDVAYTFKDALGTENTFYNINAVKAARSFRDRMMQIEGYDIDRALKVIKGCTMVVKGVTIKNSGEVII